MEIIQKFNHYTRKQKTSLLGVLALIVILPVTLLLIQQRQTIQQHASGPVNNFYGVSATFVGMLGQMSFGEMQANEQSPTTLMHASGVIVDTTSRPNKIYTIDNGNNR